MYSGINEGFWNALRRVIPPPKKNYINYELHNYIQFNKKKRKKGKTNNFIVEKKIRFQELKNTFWWILSTNFAHY